MAIKRVLIFILLLTFSTAYAQKKRTKESRSDSVEVKEKNLRFSILGGPGYTPDFGALIGGSALFTFKIDPTDTISNRSVVPFAFAFLFNGGINLLLRPQLYINEDKIRILGRYSYINNMDNYYGVGYDVNKNIVRSDSTTSYSSQLFQFNPIVLFRLKNSDFFLGPIWDLRKNNITEPSQGVQDDPYYIEDGGTPEGVDFLTSGLGFSLSYDTRDVPSNAYSGIYFNFQFIEYANIFGSDFTFNVTDFQYSQYLKLPKFGDRSALAWLVKSTYASGDVPFTQYASVGSPFDLRGYYKGQFRDNSASALVCEYRHMLNVTPHNFVTKMLHKVGFAAWGGLGMLGPSPWDVEGWLPNYGVGLRIEVQPRMNFRMDIGHDPVVGNTLIYFNMTEAF
ncbi:outer membrane protein assembly factor [Halosquirtibacter laminarini]|uniref:Outer membrane protein assembly factor n=1 Tax=Halosquirtibacter laminarini TaxID=3374600 RepID=A0AC61NGH0_9BACT|nr:outer membrane protein assembly factor [Prolixibacteraceae bacterium]